MYAKHNPSDELDALYFIISKTEQLEQKYVQHKTHVSFFSIIFVQNIFHCHKYFQW